MENLSSVNETSLRAMNKKQLMHFLHTQRVSLSPREHNKAFYLKQALTLLRDTTPSAPPLDVEDFQSAATGTSGSLFSAKSGPFKVNGEGLRSIQDDSLPSWYTTQGHGSPGFEPGTSGMATPFTPAATPLAAGSQQQRREETHSIPSCRADLNSRLQESATHRPEAAPAARSRRRLSSPQSHSHWLLSVLASWVAYVELWSRIHSAEVREDIRAMYRKLSYSASIVGRILQAFWFVLLLFTNTARRAAECLLSKPSSRVHRTEGLGGLGLWVQAAARVLVMAAVACMVYRNGASVLGL